MIRSISHLIPLQLLLTLARGGMLVHSPSTIPAYNWRKPNSGGLDPRIFEMSHWPGWIYVRCTTCTPRFMQDQLGVEAWDGINIKEINMEKAMVGGWQNGLGCTRSQGKLGYDSNLNITRSKGLIFISKIKTCQNHVLHIATSGDMC